MRSRVKIKGILKFSVTIVAISTAVFGFFCIGMFHEPAMAMENINMIGATTIQNEQTCCGDSVSQHIQSWTSTFLTIPREARDRLTLFTLGLLLVAVVIHNIFAQKPPNDFAFSYRQYLRHRPNLFALQPLRLAFARGILNTKVF